MSNAAHSFDNPAGRQLLAAIGKIRRMTSGDPKYHSGRKKKEYASPYLEFLDKLEKTARRMPTPPAPPLSLVIGRLAQRDASAGMVPARVLRPAAANVVVRACKTLSCGAGLIF